MGFRGLGSREGLGVSGLGVLGFGFRGLGIPQTHTP